MKRFLPLLLVLFAASASAQVNNRGVIVKDEGTTQGFARSIDFVGSMVSCGISGGAGTCTFTAPTVTPATLKDATYCPDVGASDAYVCSMVSAPSSYAAGMLVTLSANTANTGTASVNVNSLGVKTITRADGSTLVTGDITATSPVLLEYDGTNFRMLSQWMRGSTGTGNYALSASPTFTGTITAAVYNSTGNQVHTGETYFLTSGSGPGAAIRGLAALTPDAAEMMLYEGAYSSGNVFHIVPYAGGMFDYQAPCFAGLGTTACPDPTYAFHSNNAVTNQALAIGHNKTQGFLVANGGVLARSLTYASGSDVGLTVQGSLTGNIQNWKNSAGTTSSFIDASGTFNAPNGGTTTLAALKLNGFTTGFMSNGTGQGLIFFSSAGGGNHIFTAKNDLVTMRSTGTYGWAASTDSDAAQDTGLKRYSAGVVMVTTTGSTINGLLGGGAAVASATALPLPTGRVFHVTGTTTITSITSTNFASGAVITLIFDGALTFTDGSNLKLAGDFVTTADDTITLVYDGTNWYETARSIN